MSNKYFNSKMESKTLNYLIEKEVPLKFHYTTGEKEEGVLLQKYDLYKYLVFNPKTKISSMIHKSNVVKIDTMIKLNSVIDKN